MQHHFIQIDEHEFHTVESGPSQQTLTTPTLVFLHGFPEHWRTWQAQLNHLSQHYRVIAVDLLGYNLSSKPTELAPYEVPNLIDSMAKLIKVLGRGEPVYLVAHDWGGAIGWPMVAFHSHLFKGLVILNSAHPSTFTREMLCNPAQRQKSAYIHQLVADDAEQTVSKDQFQFLLSMLVDAKGSPVLSEELSQFYQLSWQREGVVTAMLNYYRCMPQLPPSLDSEAKAQGVVDGKIPNIRINVPTYVLWGEQDEAFVPQVLDGLETYVEDCTVERFPHASHWLHHEQPELISHKIGEFVEEVEAALVLAV